MAPITTAWTWTGDHISPRDPLFLANVQEESLSGGRGHKRHVAVLEPARAKGARKVVFASSASLYDGVPTPHREGAVMPVKDYYIEARLAIERRAELDYQPDGLNYAGLRFFSVLRSA